MQICVFFQSSFSRLHVVYSIVYSQFCPDQLSMWLSSYFHYVPLNSMQNFYNCKLIQGTNYREKSLVDTCRGDHSNIRLPLTRHRQSEMRKGPTYTSWCSHNLLWLRFTAKAAQQRWFERIAIVHKHIIVWTFGGKRLESQRYKLTIIFCFDQPFTVWVLQKYERKVPPAPFRMSHFQFEIVQRGKWHAIACATKHMLTIGMRIEIASKHEPNIVKMKIE